MSRNQLVKEKKKGGLGIRSLIGKNKALLFKWFWRLGDGIKGGWQEFISGKYRPRFETGLHIFNGPLSKTWKGIYSVINSDDQVSEALKGSCFKVGTVG